MCINLAECAKHSNRYSYNNLIYCRGEKNQTKTKMFNLRIRDNPYIEYIHLGMLSSLQKWKRSDKLILLLLTSCSKFIDRMNAHLVVFMNQRGKKHLLFFNSLKSFSVCFLFTHFFVILLPMMYHNFRAIHAPKPQQKTKANKIRGKKSNRKGKKVL